MIIYKYLTKNGAIQTISNNSVLLKCPKEYNDPFDCFYSFSDEEKEKAYELYLNFSLFQALYCLTVKGDEKHSFIKTYSKYWKKEDILSIAEEIKQTRFYKFQPSIDTLPGHIYEALNEKPLSLKRKFRKMLAGLPDKIRSIVLMACFGQTNDSILMWAHYAENHEGACLEFEIDDKDFRPVHYSDDLPMFEISRALGIIFGHQFVDKEIDVDGDDFEFALEPLLTKSTIWEYEKEIRCAYSKNKPNKRINKQKSLLEMPKIKKIYIGCRASKDFYKSIKIAAGDIPVVKMEMSDKEYKIFPKE